MTTYTKTNDEIISLQEMSKKLGISADALKKRCQRSQMPAYKYCGKWVFLLSEVIEDIKTNGINSSIKKAPIVYSTGAEESDLELLRKKPPLSN